MKKANFALLILFFSSLVALPSLAKKTDLHQQIKINASRSGADLKNKIFSYMENVVITQGTLTINADLVQVITKEGKAADSEEKTYIAKGQPATFEQTLEDGNKINLEADEIRYDPTLNTIVLLGNALLRQEGSEVRGSKITYNSETEYVNAESNSNDQVKTVIQPKAKSVSKIKGNN